LHDTPNDQGHWHHAAVIGYELESHRVCRQDGLAVEAWDISLIEAMEAIQALAAQYITEQEWDEC
jgi:hypothetical protein